MESFEDIFKEIISNAKTKDRRDSTIKILDEFIKQIDRAECEFNNLKDVFSFRGTSSSNMGDKPRW
ncbi:hypothetical protein [Helicobacter sp. MIT 14-3879]|uniref:hypothetical protein n=1 Tax=Helicobacter sp. MIT 14-3879 TaxID=2040649 RepID=UPI000E1E42EE|nr:hypothetical protein [Helicobacter sp. MIT 14-3879]RDU64814.1 hypothetical protein CQA44_03645 [Helicobacter sp. MIT 14-3879]